MIANAPDITQLIRHILRSTLSLGPARSTYHHAHPRYIHSTIATLRCLTHASLDREPAPSSTWQTLKISRPTDTTVASRKSVPGSARSTVCPFTTKMSMQNAGVNEGVNNLWVVRLSMGNTYLLLGGAARPYAEPPGYLKLQLYDRICYVLLGK